MKKRLIYITFFVLSLSISLLPVLSGAAETGPIIKLIEFRGNTKISSDTIISRITSRTGETFSKNTVRNDLKELYKIGYFDDIQIEIEPFEGGIKLIFIFSEKPSLTYIDFQGNDEFETEELREKVTIGTGAIASLSLITDNVNKLISFYQSKGYWHVKIVPVIREISGESVALTFQIEEGPKVKIRKISIEGNHAISDKKIKKVMETKEWWFLSFITGSGLYQKDYINLDLFKIRELYNSRGYIYAVVQEPEISLSSNRKKLDLSIIVSEGDQYSIGELSVKGNTVFTETELFELVKSTAGQIFDRTALRTDIDRIIDRYMDIGYARVDINPLVDVNKKEKTADIVFSISEDNIYRIGRISVSGNTKTRDKVIRREIRLDEGDIFSKSKIDRSEQRINNLNFFEEINISSMPRTEEKAIDLDVKVKEKLTGMISLGAGYSSIDKAMVMGEITQDNLFGKGLYLKLRLDYSSRRTNYNLSLKDPWFMDKPISASISLYKEDTEFPDYDKSATGGSIGFGKELSEYVGGRIVYNLEHVEITAVDDSASSIIKEQAGKKITSSISPSIWRDTRDNYLDPTKGSRNSLSLTIAGLGGDNYFYKALVDSAWHFPSIWTTTFSIRGRIGYADGFAGKDLPLYERFYVGGINTIRGLGFGEAGPRDKEDEKIGGNLETILNTEFIFPISKEIKFKGLVFFDYGGSFDKNNISLKDMRQTAGVGVRWLSPFGPIRLEWGYNLDPRLDEGSSKLEFSMGGFF